MKIFENIKYKIEPEYVRVSNIFLREYFTKNNVDFDTRITILKNSDYIKNSTTFASLEKSQTGYTDYDYLYYSRYRQHLQETLNINALVSHNLYLIQKSCDYLAEMCRKEINETIFPYAILLHEVYYNKGLFIWQGPYEPVLKSIETRNINFFSKIKFFFQRKQRNIPIITVVTCPGSEFVLKNKRFILETIEGNIIQFDVSFAKYNDTWKDVLEDGKPGYYGCHYDLVNSKFVVHDFERLKLELDEKE